MAANGCPKCPALWLCTDTGTLILSKTRPSLLAFEQQSMHSIAWQQQSAYEISKARAALQAATAEAYFRLEDSFSSTRGTSWSAYRGQHARAASSAVARPDRVMPCTLLGGGVKVTGK